MVLYFDALLEECRSATSLRPAASVKRERVFGSSDASLIWRHFQEIS